MKLLLFLNMVIVTVLFVDSRHFSDKPESQSFSDSDHDQFEAHQQMEMEDKTLNTTIILQPYIKDWGQDESGLPISPEEFRKALADDTLIESPPPEDAHAIENSGEYEGDIKLTPDQQAQMEKVRSAIKGKLWENGIIPYTISEVFTTSERLVIARAMAEFQVKTCISFISRTTESDYIHIISGSGCWSYIGPIGGKQDLSLKQAGCVYFGIAIHEFLHASGFYHEQSRYDRDNYVTINWENIKSGKERNFEKKSSTTTTNLGLEYDYTSVMHYPGTAFSKNGKPTITSKKPGVTLGQLNGFSHLDVIGVNLLYKCNKEICPDGSIEIGTQCVIITNKKKNWYQSKAACEKNSAQLVSLKDPMALRDYVIENFPKSSFWVGGRYYRKGGWKWISGAQFNASFPWGINDNGVQQNKGKKQDCMILRYFPIQDEQEYVDNRCNKKNYFICEKPKVKREIQ